MTDSPEYRLLQALMIQTAEDIAQGSAAIHRLANKSVPIKRGRREQMEAASAAGRDAIRWVTDETPRPFGFEWTARTLGYDPDRLRRKLLLRNFKTVTEVRSSL